MALSKECCTPGPPPEEGGAVGEEEQIGGIDVYVNWPAGSTKAVVFASDVFGWQKPLFRKFADKAAGAGFIAVIPDFFKGDTRDVAKDRDGWFGRHPPEGASTEETLTVIKGLKEKGVTSIGIAGFCYGAKVAVLCGKEGAVDAIAVLHPSLLTVDDIKALTVPFAFLGAELERDALRETGKEIEAYLKSQSEIEYSVKTFPGVSHGWSVRYDEKDEKAVKSAEEAQSDTISWFKKYLVS